MEVVDVPYGGDHRVVGPVGIHRALFLRKAAAEGAQSIIGGGEGIAQVAEILRGHLSNRRLVRALQRAAPDIETADSEAMRQLLPRRDLKGVVIGVLVCDQVDVLSHGAGVDAGRTGWTRPDTGIELAPVWRLLVR